MPIDFGRKGKSYYLKVMIMKKIIQVTFREMPEDFCRKGKLNDDKEFKVHDQKKTDLPSAKCQWISAAKVNHII